MTDWILDCSPREVQQEALSRSYAGLVTRNRLDGAGEGRRLPHYGEPARGWGHFMEMRLGKTPVALNEFLLLRRDRGVRRLLVLAPNKFKATWKSEARKFGVDAPAFVYESKGTNGLYQQFLYQAAKAGTAVLIANYEALRSQRHFARILEFVDGHRCMLVLDESAMVKSRIAVVSKMAHAIARKVEYRRALSGMPAPYAPYDLWSQLRILDVLADRYPNFYAFKHTFTEMGGWKGKQPVGIRNEGRLNAFLEERSFRARKIDWGFTMGVDYELVGLDMTRQQKTFYLEMERDFVTWLSEGKCITAENAMTKYHKLQQIASGFLYDENGAPAALMDFDKTPKFQDLKDRLDNYIPGKVLVIAHYKATIRSLCKFLSEYHPAHIAGGMKSSDVECEKRRFNESPACRVMIGQAQAIKYGHTLIGNDAMPCSSICFFENSYNLDTRAQCEARPQGAHQKAQVHIWDYHSCDVEKRITTALQKRQRVSNVIMDAYRA